MQLRLVIPVAISNDLPQSEFIQPLGEHHITIKHFGNVSRAEFAEIKRRLDFFEFKPFTLTLATSYDCFANWSRCRTLYIPVSSRSIIELHEQITAVFRDMFTAEQFIPHVSVARITKHIPKNELQVLQTKEFPQVDLRATHMLLVSSQLTEKSLVHTVEKKVVF